MRVALSTASFIDHWHAWLPDAEATRAALTEEVIWEQREIVLFGRRVLQPRLIGWAGALPYRYSGQTLPPRPATPTVAALLARVSAVVGAPFNHVLLNRYRDGRDSMGYHADAEPELGPDPVVATLSLGVGRRLLVRPRQAAVGPPHVFDCQAGDLLVMGGACQREFQHGIPRAEAVRDERISLTFRNLLRAPS